MGAGSSKDAPKAQARKSHGHTNDEALVNNVNVEFDATKAKGTSDPEGDGESFDSANSDDTYSVYHCRMPTYEAVHHRETHDKAIEIIAKENEATYTTIPENDDTDKADVYVSKEMNVGYGRNGRPGQGTHAVTFEVDTIGYYVSKSNLEANEQFEKDAVKETKESTSHAKPCENGEPKMADTNQLYEQFKQNYSSRSTLIKKKSLANKQTLVLTKVGNRYKYTTVPAYLPGQQLYSSRSIAKNYMTSPQYVYRRGNQKGILGECDIVYHLSKSGGKQCSRMVLGDGLEQRQHDATITGTPKDQKKCIVDSKKGQWDFNKDDRLTEEYPRISDNLRIQMHRMLKQDVINKFAARNPLMKANAQRCQRFSLRRPCEGKVIITQKQIKQARRLRRRNLLRKADPKVMAALRRKFVQQAKKYFGYPYAKKYWPPDSPEYRSNLFLDCCGLVRQVMRDLAEDFGFVIGPWNQAYMFDTLPIVVENEKDMRPGDLVFISATYYNPKSKKQPHNMTHVEIWLGDGPKTIGARWNNGKVQVFDSYRFTAMSYYDETYHFRSLDTWLKGICKSYCKQHKWKRRKFNPHKKSVFSINPQQSTDEQNGQQDEKTSGKKNGVDKFMVRGNSFCSETNPTAMKTSKKRNAESQKSSTTSSPTIASSSSSSSPITGSATPDILDDDMDDYDDEELLAADIDVDDDCSDVGSDLESGSEDSEDEDLEFIDAGDADDDYPDQDKSVISGISNDLQDGIEAVVKDISTKSGKLVDLDNRGIYLKDLLAGGEAKSSSIPDNFSIGTTDKVNQEMNKSSNGIQKDTKVDVNNSSILGDTRKDTHLVEGIQSLSLADESEEKLNGVDETTQEQPPILKEPPNSNQNALPENRNGTNSCHKPASFSHLNPDSSTASSDSSIADDVNDVAESNDSKADSNSTEDGQEDIKGAC